MKMNLKIVFIHLIIISCIIISSCGKNYTEEQKKYIAEVEMKRAEKDSFMKNDPSSPFNLKGKIHFEPLKYFEVDPSFVFKSKLNEYSEKDTITIFGTKGEERKVVKYGFISFDYKNKNYKMNVYKGVSRSGEEYFSLWFTDKTTNNETYGVGRYIDFDLKPNVDFVYTIDFNLAYNPYCAYSPNYSCAVPTKDDYIDIAITAGEKKFHN